MSRKFLLCTAATAALLTGPAIAADLPVKAPPALAWSWAGFYIGAHGGYGWKQNDFSWVNYTAPFTTLDGIGIDGIDSKGWVAGGQAGYNWQYGRWVAGVEVDGSATQIRGTSRPVIRPSGGGITVTETSSDDVRYLATARARLGVAAPLANSDVLLYGTGGLAWERVNRIDNGIFVVPPTTTTVVNITTPRSHFGWVAGVGGELRLGATNWIGRVEYLHYDFGTVELTQSITGPTISGADKGGRQTIDVVRGGLSYKFDSTGSPLSAYAASMPVKALPAPAWSWAGFYLGAHGGYGWKQNDFSTIISVDPFLALGGIDSKGWVAGGHAGYNWQYGRWVTGFELDGSATDIRGTSAPVVQTAPGPITTTSTVGDDVKYLGTVRARVGGAVPFASTDVLLYGTAGLAWERMERNNKDVTVIPGATAISSATVPRDHFGWVAGVGGEFRLGASNWIGRVEYLHYDFGTVEHTQSFTAPTISLADKGGRQTIDVVRGGLSYKFDSTASPLSAYAASVPVKAVPAAPWSWAGYYIGAHGGYGWKQNDYSASLDADLGLTIGGIDSQGWVAGGQAGYNWQFGRWVAGLELDGSATRIRGDATPVVGPFPFGSATYGASDDVKYLGTVRARVGGTPFANADVLLYGTAGLAWERANRIDTVFVVSAPPVSQTITGVTPRDHFGWVAGVGGEFRLGASNWIGRVEYLHYDFGQVERAETIVTTPATAGTIAEKGGRQTIDVVRGGISYKFAAMP